MKTYTTKERRLISRQYGRRSAGFVVVLGINEEFTLDVKAGFLKKLEVK